MRTHTIRWGVVALLTALLAVAGCGDSEKKPKVDNEPALKPLPPPDSPGGAGKGKQGQAGVGAQ